MSKTLSQIATALESDKTAIRQAILSGGGTCPEDHGFDSFASDIGTIEKGGIYCLNTSTSQVPDLENNIECLKVSSTSTSGTTLTEFVPIIDMNGPSYITGDKLNKRQLVSIIHSLNIKTQPSNYDIYKSLDLAYVLSPSLSPSTIDECIILTSYTISNTKTAISEEDLNTLPKEIPEEYNEYYLGVYVTIFAKSSSGYKVEHRVYFPYLQLSNVYSVLPYRKFHIDAVNETYDWDGCEITQLSTYNNIISCNVADNGAILAYNGDADYTEDGSNGQVMTKIPKFYYYVDSHGVTTSGSALDECTWYISDSKLTSDFKLHPAFIDSDGFEHQYILIGKYLGVHELNGEYVELTSYNSNAKLSSVYKTVASNSITRANFENNAVKRGSGWHIMSFKVAQAIRLLRMIDIGFTTDTVGDWFSNNIKKALHEEFLLSAYVNSSRVLYVNDAYTTGTGGNSIATFPSLPSSGTPFTDKLNYNPNHDYIVCPKTLRSDRNNGSIPNLDDAYFNYNGNAYPSLFYSDYFYCSSYNIASYTHSSCGARLMYVTTPI